MPRFQLVSDFQPTGDQPQAIKELVAGLHAGYQHQTLLGATGTGKTFVVSEVIEKVQKPTLVLAHNKTLAAQLYAEFTEFFPRNSVEYFVSYYDYYQPEAYIPRHDLYIEKEADINEEISRLRLSATTALFSRSDVIIVASVSCIYAIGDPQEWGRVMIELKQGERHRRDGILRHLVSIHYERNDFDLKRGAFRVRGDTLEIAPAYGETAYRIGFWGDEVERITEIDTLTGEVLTELDELRIFPAKHFITPEEKLDQALADIEAELEEQLKELKAQGKLLEAQRLEQRVQYDLEMIREIGYCSGIENYSRHLQQRPPGSPPWTLMDYFPADYLLVVDESHMTIPQVRGMFHGDRSRKETLIDYGFRLPSARDNRPLDFEEFEAHLNQVIYTSATPGPYEMGKSQQVVQQIIRPTGIVDPQIVVKPVQGQVDDLVGQIHERVARGERVLVTTLTKRMAEDLADYLKELEIKVHYLHSEVQTLERVEILRDLRLGAYDVVVGINLLREGLDLPEVSLVAILDADKEGFLRSDTALIQTTGRAARHVNGTVIMYANQTTDSMKRAIEETERRRKVQIAYNEEHGIEPASIVKEVRDLTDRVRAETAAPPKEGLSLAQLPKDELSRLIRELEKQMKAAAKDLEFEKAALLRDQVFELRAALAEKDEAEIPAWERERLVGGRRVALSCGIVPLGMEEMQSVRFWMLIHACKSCAFPPLRRNTSGKLPAPQSATITTNGAYPTWLTALKLTYHLRASAASCYSRTGIDRVYGSCWAESAGIRSQVVIIPCPVKKNKDSPPNNKTRASAVLRPSQDSAYQLFSPVPELPGTTPKPDLLWHQPQKAALPYLQYLFAFWCDLCLNGPDQLAVQSDCALLHQPTGLALAGRQSRSVDDVHDVGRAGQRM